jgi:hypothetical protein
MKRSFFLLISLWLLPILVSACGDKPIGQPCTFGWPKTADGNSTDCTQWPKCAPLQDDSGQSPNLNNNACPVDCIDMPSLQCENLICVATTPSGADQFSHMNGQCSRDIDESQDCQNIAEFSCGGYCSKECLSDASCPKGYNCGFMAPFGPNLTHCDKEEEWGTLCTDQCVTSDETPSGATQKCPATNIPNAVDYSLCAQPAYGKCCACICNQFCPLRTKKFCRKTEWDQKMFKDATTNNSSCGAQ